MRAIFAGWVAPHHPHPSCVSLLAYGDRLGLSKEVSDDAVRLQVPPPIILLEFLEDVPFRLLVTLDGIPQKFIIMFI